MQSEAPVVDSNSYNNKAKMSITLDNSDFQFLQDQLVELKNKNYELAERNRRGQADFEAAKAKICSLQLKLEEQERDFQVTSTTLRREIEAVSTTAAAAVATSAGGEKETATNKEEDYKSKYKKVLVKAKEIQQRYEKLDSLNKDANERVKQLEEENTKLADDLISKESEWETRLNEAIKIDKCQQLEGELGSALRERDSLREELDEAKLMLESQAEEKKIHERKGLQIVKELKRQVNQEKTRAETLQKRLEELLSQPPTPMTSDVEAVSEDPLSTSTSSTNDGGGNNGNGSRGANQDISSVGSWSFVPTKCEQQQQQQSTGGNLAPNETMSLCSIDSEGRETVQQPANKASSESSMQRNASITSDKSRQDKLSQQHLTAESPAPSMKSNQSTAAPNSTSSYHNSGEAALLMQEQAALVERLTRMQHEKWQLEEKLSYLEQANSALSEDLANKSNVIRSYFLNQAQKTLHSDFGEPDFLTSSRRTSIPGNFNHLLTAKPNIKKVVDFLKEKATDSSETVSREATKKMQLMLEETLIKCIKLQENLDTVTSELNKLKV